MLLSVKRNPVKVLQVTTVLYILSPALLFLLTWVRLSIGIPCVVLLGGIAAFVFTRPQHSVMSYPPSWNRRNLLLTSILSLGYLILFGFGEFNWQLFDYQFHNAKYHDLIVNPWPVYYAKYHAFMCYYNAYYLPVAFLSKVSRIEYARYLALIWTWIGVLLICWWVLVLSPKRPWWVFLVIVLFSNCWIVIWLLRAINLGIPYLSPNFIDFGTFPFIVMSPFSDHLVWAPQHAIPALLAAFSLTSFYQQRQEEWLPITALLLGGALFWGPFAVIGSIPFVLYLIWLDRWRFIKKPAYLLYSFLVGLGLFPLITYLVSTRITADPTVNMFITQSGAATWPLYYLLYIGTDFAIWYFLLRWLMPNENKMHEWLTVAIVTLCLMPFYRVGIMNDWQMRTNIPAYCIIILFSAQWLVTYRGSKQWIRWGFIAFWAINGLSTLKFAASFIPPHATTTFITQPSDLGDESTPDLAVRHYNPATSGQYLLRSESVFEKYFMKTRTKL